MDTATYKALQDKNYDKRKATAIDLERHVTEALVANEPQRVHKMLQQLEELVSSTHSHIRSGGLIGLTGVAMGVRHDTAPFLSAIIHPILRCFQDTDARTRYYALECMYNVAKFARAHMLPYFDPLLDACSRLAADRDHGVHQSLDLVDRVMRDIITEEVGVYKGNVHMREESSHSTDASMETALKVQSTRNAELHSYYEENIRSFSLAGFIPLLQERLTVLNPQTRFFFLTWIEVLNNIPELDLITWLPSFLKELIVFVSDPSREVSLKANEILAKMLNQIAEAVDNQHAQVEKARQRQERRQRRAERDEQGGGGQHSDSEDESDSGEEDEGSGLGLWEPGQGVQVNHAAVIEILIGHLHTSPHTDTQRLCHHWIQSFIAFSQDTVVPFTPRLIGAVLPLLAVDDPAVHDAAVRTNEALLRIISELPRPERSRAPSFDPGDDSATFPSTSSIDTAARPQSLDGAALQDMTSSQHDPLDYQRTVDELITQLVPDQETTRLASLEWLVMLHTKASDKVRSLPPAISILRILLLAPIRSMTPDFFPALLKFLSDQAASESVIIMDLALISQISRDSNDSSFRSFMRDLLALFGTDRSLLERRGSLIIRELCQNLDAEKIYRQCAELLEKEDDLEFASIMVQHLNVQLLTAPGLHDFRKRFKGLDSKDGQGLFVALYRAWSHNAVSTLALCFLAQVYEHTYALLQSFADLEITVSMYTQLDKLVQLLESPVFIALRLQLLEPDKHPFLYKALYAYLMLLPQSTAFSSLRGRLSAVNALGYLGFQNVLPRPPSTSSSASANGPASASSALRPRNKTEEGIKWSELLNHFKALQAKHERSRKSPHLLPMAMHSPPPEPSVTDGSSLQSRGKRRQTTHGAGVVKNKTSTMRLTQSPPPTGRRMVSAAATMPGRRPP